MIDHKQDIAIRKDLATNVHEWINIPVHIGLSSTQKSVQKYFVLLTTYEDNSFNADTLKLSQNLCSFGIYKQSKSRVFKYPDSVTDF